MLDTRAVMRLVASGNSELCTGCEKPIRFSARQKASKVVANVYVDGAWNRVEHWHTPCYDEAGEPYGEPSRDQRFRSLVAMRAFEGIDE